MLVFRPARSAIEPPRSLNMTRVARPSRRMSVTFIKTAFEQFAAARRHLGRGNAPLQSRRALPRADHPGQRLGDRQQFHLAPASPDNLESDRKPLGGAGQRQDDGWVAGEVEGARVGQDAQPVRDGSGPQSSPRARAASASRARRRAPSASRVTIALSEGLWRSIWARCASTTSAADSWRRWIAAASSRAVVKRSAVIV